MPARVLYVVDDIATTLAGASLAVTSEDAAFPKNNVLSCDRRRRWRTLASPPSTVNVDIDLGQVRTCSGFGVMWLQSDAAAGSRPAVAIQSGSDFTSQATRATIAAGVWDTAVDAVGDFAAQVARYWRIQFTGVTARFAVGKIILGTAIDFGVLYAQGEHTPQLNRTTLRDTFGHRMDVLTGDPLRLYSYGYRTSSDAEYSNLEKIAFQSQPFGLVDSKGNSAHVVIAANGNPPFKHVFGASWDCTVTMEQLT